MGPTRDNPALDPLALLLLYNREYINFTLLPTARTPANVTAALGKVTMFDANVPVYLSLGAGVFSIDIVIFDVWGASTIYTIPTPLTVS